MVIFINHRKGYGLSRGDGEEEVDVIYKSHRLKRLNYPVFTREQR